MFGGHPHRKDIMEQVDTFQKAMEVDNSEEEHFLNEGPFKKRVIKRREKEAQESRLYEEIEFGVDDAQEESKLLQNSPDVCYLRSEDVRYDASNNFQSLLDLEGYAYKFPLKGSNGACQTKSCKAEIGWDSNLRKPFRVY
jgi:hypothetical protein